MTGMRRLLTLATALAVTPFLFGQTEAAAAERKLELPVPESGTWLALESAGISSDLSLRDPAVTPGAEPWQRLVHASVSSFHNEWYGGNRSNPKSVEHVMRGSATLAAPVPAGTTVGMRFGFGHREAGVCVMDSSFEVTATGTPDGALTTVTGDVAREAVAKDCSLVVAFDPATGRTFDALSGTLMFWQGAPSTQASSQGRQPVQAYASMNDRVPASLGENAAPWQRITNASLVVVGGQLQARVETQAPVPAGESVQLRVGMGTWLGDHCLPRAWSDFQLGSGSGQKILTVGDVQRRTNWTCAFAKTSERDTPTQPYDEVTGLLVHRADDQGRAAATLVGRPVIRKGAWSDVRVVVRDVNADLTPIQISGLGTGVQVHGVTTAGARSQEVTLRVRATKPGVQTVQLRMVDDTATITQTLKLNVR